MSGSTEWRALVASAVALAVVAVTWVGGWAVREATDVDPTALERLSACLGERGLAVVSPADDPLAASAPHGSLSTTIEGTNVTVSLWDDAAAAERTLATYDSLTGEDLSGRAVSRDDRAILWGAPPTDEQASILYGCAG